MFVGLSDQEVQVRRLQYGRNELPEKKNHWFGILIRQCNGSFNYLLYGAAFVSYILDEYIDALFIIVFVLFGIVLSFYQEYKSDRAVRKLRAYLTHTISVRRNNEDVEIPVDEVVEGDIVRLELGDIIPADGVVRSCHGFIVDETTFTGESVPVPKEEIRGDLKDEKYFVSQGTTVVGGWAYIEVLATGSKTRFASIAKKVSETETESELTKNINHINAFILHTTIITLVVIFCANLFIDQNLAGIPTLVLFSITLAISVVPETLPLVMTFLLSRSSLRLASKGVIVKRLSSVQDLGSVDLLCSDKTGTLTENKLVYRNEYIIPEASYRPLVFARLAAQDLNQKRPEPFDVAIDTALKDVERVCVAQYQLEEEEVFDPCLRSNGVVVRDEYGKKMHIRRGSPEYFFEQGVVSRERVAEWLMDEEQKGHRILGVSYDYGDGMRFGGFVSFEDVLKDSTIETLEQARKLNVRVAIITGDSHVVAEAVGRQTGIVSESREVVDATEFLAQPHHIQEKQAEYVHVFARTKPEQKFDILLLLKKTHTIAYLGEGINDSPALKVAHVSMVVQSASDIARETADIVLLKSDLRVIIEGIRYGRETHTNILKYIRATLISNFGNFYAVAVSSLFVTFLPMLPKQILLLDLLSDFPMMAIVFDKVRTQEIARPQKYHFRSLYMTFIALGLVSTLFDLIFFGIFFTSPSSVLQTNWFIASVITEILLIFSVRSYLPIYKAGLPTKTITTLSGVVIMLTIILPFLPSVAHFFGFVAPSFTHLILIITIAFIYLIVTEIMKQVLKKKMV